MLHEKHATARNETGIQLAPLQLSVSATSQHLTRLERSLTYRTLTIRANEQPLKCSRSNRLPIMSVEPRRLQPVDVEANSSNTAVLLPSVTAMYRQLGMV